jgi:hypothetical protein
MYRPASIFELNLRMTWIRMNNILYMQPARSILYRLYGSICPDRSAKRNEEFLLSYLTAGDCDYQKYCRLCPVIIICHFYLWESLFEPLQVDARSCDSTTSSLLLHRWVWSRKWRESLRNLTTLYTIHKTRTCG